MRHPRALSSACGYTQSEIRRTEGLGCLHTHSEAAAAAQGTLRLFRLSFRAAICLRRLRLLDSINGTRFGAELWPPMASRSNALIRVW